MAEHYAPVPHVDPIEIEINQMFDQMHFCLDQRRVAVLTAYRDLKLDIASRPLVRVRREQEMTVFRAETEDRIQMNQNRQVQERILNEIDLELAKIRTPQPDTRVVFRSLSVPLEQLIAQLGEVLEEEMPIVLEEEMPFVPKEKVPIVPKEEVPIVPKEEVPIVPKEEMPIVPNYQAMRPVVAVRKSGGAPGELYYPRAVAIDSNDRIFVAEGYSTSHARISVFSERGEFLTSFSHQDMKYPWGVAIHGDNLYVTDIEVHSIFHFKIEAYFPLVTKRGTKGRSLGTFNDPRNLAVSNDGDVYVTDCWNNRVQIFNSSLIGYRTLTQQPIKDPLDIKLTADEVYVLCSDNPCIHVFSHAGERLRSLISSGEQMQVIGPLFFCLDSAENILISDYSSHRIKIFTKEGFLITTIGEEGDQAGMFHYPSGLALTRELSLVVISGNKNFGLQIFSCV